MPTSPDEVREMTSIINKYIEPHEAHHLFKELDDRVGSKSDNLSFKLSTLMLNTIYTDDGRSIEQKMAHLASIYKSYYEVKPEDQATPAKKPLTLAEVSWPGKIVVGSMVGFHFAVIIGILASVVVLPFATPWYVSLPLLAYTLNLIFSTPQGCLLTSIEDSLRRRFGMQEVKRFVRHYIYRKDK